MIHFVFLLLLVLRPHPSRQTTDRRPRSLDPGIDSRIQAEPEQMIGRYPTGFV